MGPLLQALLLDIPETLETPRLRLRATRAGLGRVVNEAVRESHAELAPWMPWARELPTLEDSETHCRDAQAKWHSREMIDFAFFRAGDDAFVGKGGLHTIDWALPKFEIGYWIRTSSAGQGYATEATVALTELARGVLGARRIEITSAAGNPRSRRVAEKAGYTLEGVLRGNRRGPDGALYDSCMYARIF